MKGRREVRVDHHFLLGLLRDGSPAFAASGLPADAAFVSWSINHYGHLCMVVTSAEWATNKGDVVPELDVTMTMVEVAA